jgi:hypothetical protein
LAAYISPNRLLVELVIGAPDYPPAEDALVAAMRVRGHTDDGTYHSLAWLRKNGVFAPRRDGRVRLSAASLAKRERGEELRDGRGAVLWAPPLVVPAEVATWESRLIDASRGGTPGPGNAVNLLPDRPRVDPARRAAEVSRLAALTEKEYAAEREVVAKAWGLDDLGMLDLMVVPAREQGNAVPPQAVIPRAERRARKLAAQENCVQRYIELIQAHPGGAPEPRAVLEKKMMKDFDVGRDDARKARAEAIRRKRRSLPHNSKWDQPGAPGK